MLHFYRMALRTAGETGSERRRAPRPAVAEWEPPKFCSMNTEGARPRLVCTESEAHPATGRQRGMDHRYDCGQMAGERSDWLGRTDRAVERLSDDLAATDVRTSAFLLRQFVDALEAPPDALLGAVLSTVLIDVCGRVVHALHEQNPSVSCACEATIWSHVSRFAKWRDRDPRLAFLDWLDTFFVSLDREHPPDSALRAAQIIRRDPTRAWRLAALAEAAQASPSRLRRDFLARFGMRPATYVHLARTTRAVHLLRTAAKVEAVAWEVGYRSKKDLYAALSRWAGATPTELRTISDDECEWLERGLRILCVRGAKPLVEAGASRPAATLRRRTGRARRGSPGTQESQR
jgi:AraC-like DNA-binding protein